jgi:hypothetical protein
VGNRDIKRGRGGREGKKRKGERATLREERKREVREG